MEVPIHDGKGGSPVGGCRRQELPDVGVLDGRDDAGPRLDDAHLLPGVVERGRAEHGRVVDGDMRQHGDAARDDVRGIPGAAHARLVDARVDAVHRHPFERHHRGELEVGHDLARLALDELDEGQEVLDQGGELFGGDGLEQDVLMQLYLDSAVKADCADDVHLILRRAGRSDSDQARRSILIAL